MAHSAPRTAIVTGAAKRVGQAIAQALIADGWSVIAPVRDPDARVPDGAHKVEADLADADCAEAIFRVAANFPPVRLLVNNAARFAWDGFGDFRAQEFDAHMTVNVRAPALLIDRFASQHDARGGDRLVVNILDAKIAAPNPDYLSYTLSKQALAGLTELAARALAERGVRVNAIAPALMLRSPGQSEENFAAMHSHNPLRRGVEPADVVGALAYLIGAPAVTGQTVVIDAGQRFMALPCDVQFIS